MPKALTLYLSNAFETLGYLMRRNRTSKNGSAHSNPPASRNWKDSMYRPGTSEGSTGSRSEEDGRMGVVREEEAIWRDFV